MTMFTTLEMKSSAQAGDAHGPSRDENYMAPESAPALRGRIVVVVLPLDSNETSYVKPAESEPSQQD